VTFFRDREQHPFEWTGRASKLGRWVPIPIRIIVGYGFMAHGYSKLVGGQSILPKYSTPSVSLCQG